MNLSELAENGNAKSARRLSPQTKRKLYASCKAYLFLLPLFFFLLMFSYYPAVSGIYHSFFEWKDTGASRFIGLANYK